MISKNNIFELVENEFSSFKRPNMVHNYTGNDKDLKKRYSELQNDYINLNPTKTSYNECSMLIHDSHLINDQFYLFFLPRLTKAVFLEDADEEIFLSRIKTIKLENLKDSSVRVILKLIEYLKIYIEEL